MGDKKDDQEFQEVFEGVRKILADSLEIDEGNITMDSSLNYDLGAESVDFLDISFRIDSEFDVELPNRELGQIAETINTLKIEEVNSLLARSVNSSLSEEEKKSLAILGIDSIFEKIKESHNVDGDKDLIEETAQGVIQRCIEHLKKLGFDIPEQKVMEIKGDLIEGVDPPNLLQKIMGMYSVRSLVSYILSKREG